MRTRKEGIQASQPNWLVNRSDTFGQSIRLIRSAHMTAPSAEGRRNYDLSETADDITRGHELSGISSIDDQSIPAHLPTAIKGLGSVERTLWFQVVSSTNAGHIILISDKRDSMLEYVEELV